MYVYIVMYFMYNVSLNYYETMNISFVLVYIMWQLFFSCFILYNCDKLCDKNVVVCKLDNIVENLRFCNTCQIYSFVQIWMGYSNFLNIDNDTRLCSIFNFF